MTNPSSYQLFLSQRSPFARRIRLALRRLKIPYEEKLLDVFGDNADLLKANPLGMVPTLLTPEGPLADSATILEYLHEKTGQIWPTHFYERIQARQAATLAEGIIHSSVLYFQESKLHEVPSPFWLEEHTASMARTLQFISESTPIHFWIQDQKLTQAGWDLAVGLEYVTLRYPELRWQEKYPNLVLILNEAKQSQDFIETTPKL